MSIYQSKVNWRVAWLKEEEAARKKAAEAIEKERISYASVSVKKISVKNKHTYNMNYKNKSVNLCCLLKLNLLRLSPKKFP